MTIEIPDELVSKLARIELKETYDFLKSELEECIRDRKSLNMYSEKYGEEKKELSKVVKSFEIVCNYYGIK